MLLGGPIGKIGLHGHRHQLAEGRRAVTAVQIALGTGHAALKSIGKTDARRAHVTANGENPLGASRITQSENLALLGGRASLGLGVGGRFALAVTLDAGRALRGLVITAGGQPDLLARRVDRGRWRRRPM